MKITKPVYTDDELIRRVWDVEEIKALMARRMHYIANEWREKEMKELWVQSSENLKSASFGRNWGYYTGMDAIYDYYVVSHEKKRQAHLDAICAANPKIENKTENLGIGCLVNHPLTTALVELAYDGKTAKGMWYSISQETTSNTDGTATALWMMEKVAADFIREGNDWKIWRLVIATDFSSEAGVDYGEQPVYTVPGSDPISNEFGTPSIAMLTHDSKFNWWDNYPPMPEPYYEFTNEISYGPEGHKDYMEAKYER